MKRLLTLAAAALALLVPAAVADAQAPLPACTGSHVIHIGGLSSDLTEGIKDYFTVSSDDFNDVTVTMAVQGQAPFWSGVMDPFDLDEPGLWIEADPGNPPLVVTATTTSYQSDTDEDCVDTVTRVLTHHPAQTHVVCSDYDGYDNHTYTMKLPRTCILGQQNWTYHAQGFMSMGKIHNWRGWGTKSATAQATWYENMGARAKVYLRLYRRRATDGALVYTRARVSHIRWNKHIHTRKSIVVKLPTYW